jgi:hypothetical protein
MADHVNNAVGRKGASRGANAQGGGAMTSAKDITEQLAEMTGTDAERWGYAMCSVLMCEHPVAGRFVIVGDEVHKVVPFNEYERERKRAIGAPKTTNNDLHGTLRTFPPSPCYAMTDKGLVALPDTYEPSDT